VPFPKGNPLPDLDRLADYRFLTPVCWSSRRSNEMPWQPWTGARSSWREPDLPAVRACLGHHGMEQFLSALMTHPAEVKVFLHGLADYARRVFDATWSWAWTPSPSPRTWALSGR